MDAWVWVLIAVAAAVLIGVIVAMMARRRSHQRRRVELRDRFGPEYDRTVERGGRRKGEAQLLDRERRREQLHIRPLSDAAYERYAKEWHDVQARFVDEPSVAVTEAESLVVRVMRDRGYPVDDFETQAALVSVDHPGLVENYRAAHRIHERSQRRLADTDELRQALLHYRTLFDELLVRNDASMRSSATDSLGFDGHPGRESRLETYDEPEVEEALEARFGETREERAADRDGVDRLDDRDLAEERERRATARERGQYGGHRPDSG